MHGNCGGRRERPLIPHVLRADIPPEVEHDLVVRLQLDRLAQREEDGEPGEHAGGVGGRQDADHDLLVQLALKVAAEPVEHRVSNCCEAQFGIPVIFIFFEAPYIFDCTLYCR